MSLKKLDFCIYWKKPLHLHLSNAFILNDLQKKNTTYDKVLIVIYRHRKAANHVACYISNVTVLYKSLESVRFLEKSILRSLMLHLFDKKYRNTAILWKLFLYIKI